jgi:RNA polymerase sigma-70 factor (ECF subfamily)
VRNRCLDWLRRPNPEPLAEGAEEALESDSPGPLDALERGRESGAIARCLRALEARQRQAIALAFYDGLSHAELAQHLREPLGTVKTWVRRGLAKLRSCLELQG